MSKIKCEDCGKDLEGKVQIYPPPTEEWQLLCEQCNWRHGEEELEANK